MELAVDGNRCLWGVLPATAGRKRPDTRSLSFQFERVLPFPVERLQCAFHHLADGRTVAVGLPREEVAHRRHSAPTAWTLIPDRVPERICALGIDPTVHAHLNLLTGNCESLRRRRYRTSLVAIWMAGCAIATGCLVLAAEHRRSTIATQIAALEREETDIATTAVPISADNRTLPPAARLLQAFRRISSTSTATNSSADAVLILDLLWRAWPSGTAITIREVRVQPRRLTVSGTLADPGILRTLAASTGQLSSPSGTWRWEPPDLPPSIRGEIPVVLAWSAAPTPGRP